MFTGRPSIANVTVLTPKARLMAMTKKDYRKRYVELAGVAVLLLSIIPLCLLLHHLAASHLSL